jgi:hypothetical protein
MPCERVSLPGGGFAIVCGTRSRRQRCACGQPSTQLCDWKVPERLSGTCDAPICARCSVSPAPDKDLCPAHAAAFREWSAQRQHQVSVT